MLLSLPWPKAPLFTVFLNLLPKSTAICDVFNNTVAKSIAICEVLTFSLKDVEPRQCTKTLPKPMFLPNKNGESRHPNSLEITKSGPPATRQDTWKKYASQSRESKTKSEHKYHSFFYFSLAGSGRARARTSPFRAVKKRCFLKSAVTTYQKPIVLAKKCPPQ